MLSADDAGIVSEPVEGLAKMMTVIVTVFEEANRTESAEKTETMLLRTPDQITLAPPLVVEAAGQRYIHTSSYNWRHYPRKR